jgi:hypothetical protein
LSDKTIAPRTTEIPKGRVQELISQRHAAMEGQEIPVEYIEPQIQSKQEEVLEVQDEQEEIHPPEIETAEVSPPSHPAFSEEEERGVIESSGGRRQCPACGNHDKRLIRETTDRTRVISAMAGLYGKKYICGKCGANWR